ncbi:MAG TPA: hypothetical protein VEJ86_02045 [Candidatus Binataceae bacterium]|nr:hypothetical protein [Candidatus Binataceae bacterium]
MNAMTNHAAIANFATVESADEHRILQSSFLSELPGAVFGFLTILYIVTSLAALIH